MSKVSFRARQIDFNKPLPILKDGSDILTEFSENALVNRGVPQIPSGMEKEEENEHHFVEVIHALQLRSEKDVKIPVPDIIDQIESYKKLYANGFSLPKQLFHIRTVVLADGDPVEYDMDTDDEDWLSRSELGISPEKFEAMIDRLERNCGQRVLNLEEAKGILQDKPSLVIAVYDYWLNKRVQSRQPLLFTVRHERRDGGSNTDPYVAFRRRSEKMQTRKNRKNDEQSYEKMLLFREQMESLGEVLSRLVRRETVKEALVLSDKRCFELRYQLGDWDGSSVTEAESFARKPPRVVNSSADVHSLKDFTRKRSSRKRKLTQRALDLSSHTQSSEDVEKERVECSENWPFAFVRTPGCQYLKPRDVGHGDSTSTPAFTRSPHLRYALATVPSINSSSRHIYTGYLRRRLGRGGRVICDRLGAPFELASFLRSYDEKVSSPYSLQTTSPMHLTVKPFEAKDEVLLRRLRPVLMASHQCRPSFQWPVCAKPSDPPSFEPLHPHPWKLITNSHLNQWTCPALHLNSTPMSPVMKGKNTSDSPKIIPFNSDQAYPPVLGRPPTSSQSDHTIENHDLRDGTSRYVSKSDSSIVTPPSEDRKHALLPLADSNAVSTPRRVWRKLARPFDAINALQPSDFPRSRGGETPISNSNGLASRIFQSTDDTLLLGSPVLTSSKVCNMARDHTCSGPQLPTTNGVCPPQFCQLPI